MDGRWLVPREQWKVQTQSLPCGSIRGKFRNIYSLVHFSEARGDGSVSSVIEV